MRKITREIHLTIYNPDNFGIIDSSFGNLLEFVLGTVMSYEKVQKVLKRAEYSQRLMWDEEKKRLEIIYGFSGNPNLSKIYPSGTIDAGNYFITLEVKKGREVNQWRVYI